jgi:hypothetical protein
MGQRPVGLEGEEWVAGVALHLMIVPLTESGLKGFCFNELDDRRRVEAALLSVDSAAWLRMICLKSDLPEGQTANCCEFSGRITQR